ncbi:hypothetical protein KKJ04_14770 [Xenorhabdus bovienii]|nr:hypothetical protein [Xenorhabdus bovienii]
MTNDLLEKEFPELNKNANGKNRYVVDNNTGEYFLVECQPCGEIYEAHYSGQISDTCDYGDIFCPHCGLGCNAL